MKIKATPFCDYCNEIDDIRHFFFACGEVQNFLKLFFQWWNDMDYIWVDFPNYPNAKEIVLGISDESDECQVINFCILQVKYYIYRQRLFNENYYICQKWNVYWQLN